MNTTMAVSGTAATYGNITMNLSNVTNTTFTMNVTGSAYKVGAVWVAYNCTITNGTNNLSTSLNMTTGTGTLTNTSLITFTQITGGWNVTSNNSATWLLMNDTINVSAYTGIDAINSEARCTFTMPNVLVNNGRFTNISKGIYRGIYSTGLVWGDFKTGNSVANTSNYCQSLLYFNNPYYGNIQLIPKITYVPSIDAFPDFINASSNSAYIPNNTITYVYDSITSIWYIVPAFTCTSYTAVASTSTLQYNPTATGTAPGGSVPIDVYDISGSCSYNTGTRLITCTGTDTSNTVTSLTLSAYLSGNTTDLCGSTVAGASGTLTCTLPAQNGTYNVIFYGSDANLFLHSFASKTIVIGSGTSGYGRDAYIAVMLLVGVAALLLSSNIAVSMVLTCFGLFVALAIGALPISDAPVVVFFAVIALVLAYRLKV
jgi:hypothetical protein